MDSELSRPITAVVFFVQGLAFFTLGISILVAARPKSALIVARSLWLLAAFGLLHSLGAWVEFVRQLQTTSPPLSGALTLARSGLLVIYSTALAQFGANVITSLSPRLRWLRILPLALFVWWFPVAIIVGYDDPFGASEPAQVEAVARYIVYLPGALLSAAALYMQGRALTSARLPHVERDCRNAALAFAAYGVSGGLIVPTRIVLSSEVFYGKAIASMAELPIEVIRLVLAPLIAFFIVRTLRVFEFEHYLEVEDLNKQLRWLQRRAFTAQEDERKRIARELHDETAQLLSSLLVRLKLLEHARSLDEVGRRSGELMQLATDATQSVRQMAVQLRPQALDDLGLVAALQWYTEEFASRTELKVEFGATGVGERLDAELELSIYRVVQECLTNVAKHAHATTVRIYLEKKDGTLTARVEDDGCGFDVQAAQTVHGRRLGLVGIRERIGLLGGTVRINTSPGSGTEVVVTVPVAEQKGGASGTDASGQDKSAGLRRPSAVTEGRR